MLVDVSVHICSQSVCFLHLTLLQYGPTADNRKAKKKMIALVRMGHAWPSSLLLADAVQKEAAASSSNDADAGPCPDLWRTCGSVFGCSRC